MNINGKKKSFLAKSDFRYFGNVTADLFKIMPCEIMAIILIKIANAFAAMAQVYVTARLFDTAADFMSGKADKSTLFLWSGVFIGTMIIPQFLSIIEQPISDLKIFNKHHRLINKLISGVVSTPPIRFEEPEFHNELWQAKMCVYNSGLLEYFFGYMDYLPNIFRLVGTVIVLMTFNISFVPLALISIIPSFIQKMLLYKKNREVYTRLVYLQRVHDYLWDIFTKKDSVKELRTMNIEKYISDKWADSRDKLNDEYFEVEMKATTWEMLCSAIKLSALFVSIALSVYFLGKNIISVGQFAACIAAFVSLQSTAMQFMDMLASQSDKANFAGDYYEFLKKDSETDGEIKFNGLENKIEINNISFAYPKGEKNALDNVSLTINKGERVVIVGENGSGKTTLSKIISGVYKPSVGEIKYDGVSVCEFEHESFYKHFSIVSQDFVKYHLSMRDNIGISVPSRIHDDERLMKTADSANIKNIVKRVGGLDSQLGREFDGVELSGGEWQKVAIARCINKDCGIVVLDEPTSALDPLVEYEILNKFNDITKGKTSIIISHRIGLCRFADKIIVMKKGKIVENGTHSELIALGGEYNSIWNEQAKWYV